ncbi:MAG: transaldolase family protein [Clostridiales bacterium]
MNNTYFHRLNQYSPTRFWVNNPTPRQASLSIKEGAINCTTNPTYAYKQLIDEEMKVDVLTFMKKAIEITGKTEDTVDYVQRMLVKQLLKIFLPLYEKNPGKCGFVSIQGDPNMDENPDHIIKEAFEYAKLGKNFIAKIPVTESGLIAIEACIKEGFPVIGTEIMSIAQTVALCELYKKVSESSGKKPALFVTNITGIYDQYIAEWMKKTKAAIPLDVVWYAGLTVCKKQYKIFKERNYPGVMLGGGARNFKHFTELVGYDMHITINWKNFADKLIEQDMPIINRYDCHTPDGITRELLAKVPDFKKAYDEDGLTVKDFQNFGPVNLFRNMFLDGWNNLKVAIDEFKKGGR